MSIQGSAGTLSIAEGWREAERQGRLLRDEAYAKLAELEAAGNVPAPLGMIGRCSAKGCRHAVRIDVPRQWEVRQTRVIASVPSAWGRLVDGFPFSCPAHGRQLHFRAIEGRTTEKACDVRCTTARGHKCECSCGGHNHGADLGRSS